jgi:hypothetical protein
MQFTAPTQIQTRVLVALLLTIVTMPAFSNDGKVYPGTMCQPVTDGSHDGSSNAGDLKYQINGSVLNGSTTNWMEVTCPVVRDLEITLSGIGPTTAMLVYNEASKALATCTFFSNSYYSMGWLQTKTQSQMGPGIKFIHFSQQDNNFIGGNYNIWCSIPPAAPGKAAGIFEYMVFEKD